MSKEKKREILRFIKFALFSASAGIIEIVVFTLLTEFSGWGYWACYLPALVLSVVWNFTLNRRYAFRAEGSYTRQMLLVFLFYCVFTPASTILGNYLAETLHWNDYLVTALNMIANFALEFLYDRFVVFRGQVDTNDVARRKEAASVDESSEA